MPASGGSRTETVQNAVPQYITDQHKENIGIANTIASQPYQPYTGARIAGWTQDQLSANQAVRDQAGGWKPALNGAVDTAGAVAKSSPTTVQAPTRFDAAGYLSANPDVAAWARDTAATSGKSLNDLAVQHWNEFGIAENRSGAQPRMQAAEIGSTARMDAASMNRGDIRNVTAGRFTDADLSAYMNPYTQTVIDTTLSDLSRQNDQVNNATRARLAAAGAFGGSRSAIAETENNRNYLDTSARTSAQLHAQNFGQAQAAIGQDQNRALQADGMNQGMDWNVTQGNAAFQQQANATNAAAENARLARNAEMEQAARTANLGTQTSLSQFDATQALQTALANQQAGLQGGALRLDAARTSGNLGQLMQTLGLRDAASLGGIGDRQQSLDQANLDLALGDFNSQRQYPIDMLGLRQSILSGAPYTTTQTATRPTYNNMGANFLGGALGGAQIGSATGIGGGWGALAGGLLGLIR